MRCAVCGWGNRGIHSPMCERAVSEAMLQRLAEIERREPGRLGSLLRAWPWVEPVPKAFWVRVLRLR